MLHITRTLTFIGALLLAATTAFAQQATVVGQPDAPSPRIDQRAELLADNFETLNLTPTQIERYNELIAERDEKFASYIEREGSREAAAPFIYESSVYYGRQALAVLTDDQRKQFDALTAAPVKDEDN